MKRFLITLIIIAALFSSCGTEAQKILEYQKYPMTVTGTLITDGLSCALCVTMPNENTAEISVSSPDTLKNYRFTVDGEKIKVFYEDMEIELCSVASELPVGQIADMLSLSPEDFKYSRTENDIRYDFYADSLSETVIISEKSEKNPKRIEHKRDKNTVIFEIDSLIIQ